MRKLSILFFRFFYSLSSLSRKMADGRGERASGVKINDSFFMPGGLLQPFQTV